MSFSEDFRDFINGQAVDSKTGQAILGLQTDAERRVILNDMISDLNNISENVEYLKRQSTSGFLNRYGLLLASDAYLPDRLPSVIDQFRTRVTGLAQGSYNAVRTVNVFQLCETIDNRCKIKGLSFTPNLARRHVGVAVAVVGAAAYLTVGRAEASEIEEVDNTAESNVLIYISMTAEELQAQKDRIVSDRQLLLYEQNRDTQRDSRRPSF